MNAGHIVFQMAELMTSAPTLAGVDNKLLLV